MENHKNGLMAYNMALTIGTYVEKSLVLELGALDKFIFGIPYRIIKLK